MKKVLSLVLSLMLVMTCLSVVAFASEEVYDSTWSLVVKNQDGVTDNFNPGDIIEVSIVNSTSLANKITDTTVYFTYNADALELATEDDIDAIYEAFEEEVIVACKLSSSNAAGDVALVDTETAGIFKGVFATGTSARAGANKVAFKAYFKVKSDITGNVPLNFRWIHTGKHASFVCGEDGNNYNINFADAFLTAKGATIAEEPTVLPTEGINSRPYAFAPTVNPTVENPLSVSMNGETVNVTTPYLVVFSKIAARNANAEEVGMLISKDNIADMTEETSGVKKAVALNVSSANHFGVLFHGEAFEAGNTYYTRAYAKYEDGEVIYGAVVPVTLAE